MEKAQVLCTKLWSMRKDNLIRRAILPPGVALVQSFRAGPAMLQKDYLRHICITDVDVGLAQAVASAALAKHKLSFVGVGPCQGYAGGRREA